MESGFLGLIILIILFVLLGLYDGLYLHLIRYKLYENQESKREHLIHSIRAGIFPLILYFLFLSESVLFFYWGLLFVLLDLIVLGIDAYTEKDSRQFMGGLPRWEYIIHLFVNGFHFAAIAVFLLLRISLSEDGIEVIFSNDPISSSAAFEWLIWNLIPGAIFMAVLHILLNFNKPQIFWNKFLKIFGKNYTTNKLLDL